MDISLTALNAGSTRMAVSAHNIANWMTPDYRAYKAVSRELPTQRGVGVDVVKTDTPTDIAVEMVDQTLAMRYVQANGAVARASMETLGAILNIMA